MVIFLLVLGLLLFLGLIITHELGHFWLAKRNGVEVEEFGIFFPPRLYKRKTKGGWNFTINLLPLGGFVKLKGEHDSDTGKGSFGAASVAAKSKIMIAGIAVNLVTAYLLFTFLALIGIPHLVDNQFTVKSDTKYLRVATYKTTIDTVEKNSPAARAGLKQNDVITAVGLPGHPEKLSTTYDITAATKKFNGQTVVVNFTHAGKTEQKTVTLRTDAEIAAAARHHQTIGRLGVSTDPSQDGLTTTRSTWSAPIVGGAIIGQYTGLTFEGIGKALSGLGSTIAGGLTHNTVARQTGQTEASGQVSGPVGIYFIFKYGAQLGIRFILMIVAVLAMTLGVMNLLPIPALDGGRLYLLLISRALKKPLSAKREEMINAASFGVLMVLFVLITFVDVKRFF